MNAKYVDVFIVDASYPGVAARWQQFKNIQTGEIINPEDLKGWIINETFPDTFGRLCITFKNPSDKV